MDSHIPLIKAMIPKVPLIGRTALSHTLGLSEQSSKWDLRTALTVNVLRSFIVDSPHQSISMIQRFSLKDPGIKGNIWISKVTMPRPEEDSVQKALCQAIEGLKEPGEAGRGFTIPELLPVEAEWTGYRSGANKTSVLPDISEEQKYKEMMAEVTSPTTILYFHGGGYYILDPASHRPTCKNLAKLTKGRCLSVRYRLAPQNPFPAALLDALVSYFTLLYPPAGSFHEPAKAENIVFAGDSAGGNLSLVLLQTLLEFRSQGLKITWNGEERDVLLPAGVATSSAWADVTHSSPSCETNAGYDYLPPRSMQLTGSPEYRDCEVWPAGPPRKHIYAPDGLLCHPLVSPIVAKSWEGSCPLYVTAGRELLTDENKYLAMKVAAQGVPVVFEEYEAMPHCHALVLEGSPGRRVFFDHWAEFIRNVVERQRSVVTKGTVILAKSFKEEGVDVKTLSPFTEDEVKDRMRERVGKMSIRRPDSMAKL